MARLPKVRDMAHPSIDHLADDRRSLLDSLGRLLTRIGRGVEGDSSADPGLESWEDECHLYLETLLPDASVRGVDISVHDGRVFIRMEKRGSRT